MWKMKKKREKEIKFRDLCGLNKKIWKIYLIKSDYGSDKILNFIHLSVCWDSYMTLNFFDMSKKDIPWIHLNEKKCGYIMKIHDSSSWKRSKWTLVRITFEKEFLKGKVLNAQEELFPIFLKIYKEFCLFQATWEIWSRLFVLFTFYEGWSLSLYES